MKHYKYIHIAWHKKDIKFCPKLEKMLLEQTEFFNFEDHFFITPHETTYDALKVFGNVKLVRNGNLINRYAPFCDVLIIHALMCPKIPFLFTKKKYANKVVWRTWGGDVFTKTAYEKSDIVYCVNHFLRNLYAKMHIKKCKQFRAVGIANIVDELKIMKVYGDRYMFPFPYSFISDKKIIFEKIIRNTIENKIRKIMIGHSGMPSDDHLNIIDKLSTYTGENFIISIPLAYGDSAYIEKVKKYALEKFRDRVEFITDYVEYIKYAEYISSVDVAILSAKQSNALGNYHLLSYFGKKIYINDASDMAEALRFSGCAINSISDIGCISFEKFITYDPITRRKMKEILGSIESESEKCCNLAKELENLVVIKK